MAVKPRALLEQLLRRIDRDRDGRITSADAGNGKALQLVLPLGPGLELRARGVERIAQIAALLADKIEQGDGDHAWILPGELLQGRVAATLAAVSRSWDRLTRRVDDLDSLLEALEEAPIRAADGRAYVYVPASDPRAAHRLRARIGSRKGVRVVPVPRRRGPAEHEAYARDVGIAYLPRPYLVPGGRFREMYGWDSYFQAAGALESGRLDLALGIAENLLYEIRHYGKILNTNRSYHLSRSQPPLLGRLVSSVHARLRETDEEAAERLLRRAARALEQTLQEVWSSAPRGVAECVSRYCDEAGGPVPEVPAAFFADKPRDDDYYLHDRALRESGWDLTHRFGREAHKYAPVCLNSLLYGYERDLAAWHALLHGPSSTAAALWRERAQKRKATIDRLFWDERRGMFVDYHLPTRTRSAYETAATLYPLWVGAASRAQADRVAATVGERLVARGGLLTSTAEARARGGAERFQWDHPIGWAPLQIIAVEGLRRYGHHDLAHRIAYRWLWMVLRISGEGNGLIVEKYDVVRRSVEVAAEYSNQGSDRGPYLERDPGHTLGFGWTNASIPILAATLPPRLRAHLDRGTLPVHVESAGG